MDGDSSGDDYESASDDAPDGELHASSEASSTSSESEWSSCSEDGDDEDDRDSHSSESDEAEAWQGTLAEAPAQPDADNDTGDSALSRDCRSIPNTPEYPEASDDESPSCDLPAVIATVERGTSPTPPTNADPSRPRSTRRGPGRAQDQRAQGEADGVHDVPEARATATPRLRPRRARRGRQEPRLPTGPLFAVRTWPGGNPNDRRDDRSDDSLGRPPAEKCRR